MKKILAWTLLPGLVLLLSTNAQADSDPAHRITDAIEVLAAIQEIPEQGIPPTLLRNSAGIAIVPSMIKAGFLIGGAHGRGVVLIHRKDGSWSNPAFISLSAGSFGFQVGVQSADVILVFKNRKGIDNLANGKFTLGADANVAAGPVGRSTAAATDARLKAEIYSYSRSRGLFAGISLEGSVLEIDEDANQDYYEKRNIRAKDILDANDLPSRPEAARLRGHLAQAVERADRS